VSFLATAIAGSAVVGAGASIFGSIEQTNALKQAQSTLQSTTSQGIQSLINLVNQGTGAVAANTATGAGALESNVATGASDIGALTGQAASQFAPYEAAGSAALPTLLGLLTGNGQGSAGIMQMLQNLPGFQFAQNWGMRGINNAATTSGLGGNVLTAGANYSSGLAQSTWQNIVNALQGTVNTGASAASGAAGALSAGGLSLGGLFGSAGQGLGSLYGGAGQSIGSLLGNAGSSIGNMITGMGSNVAQTQVGMGNAIAGGATGAASAFSPNNLLSMALISKLGLGGSPGTIYTGNTPANTTAGGLYLG
jgi:hypothetical protein